MKKIVNLTRHKMTPQQKAAIKKLMNGKKFKIINENCPQLNRKIIQEIVERYGTDAEYIVPGNAHIINDFLWCGVKPLRFVMQRKDATTCGAVMAYEFQGIERFKFMKLISERVV